MFAIETVYSEREMSRARDWHWKKYGPFRYWWNFAGIGSILAGLFYLSENSFLGVMLLIYGGYCLLRNRMLRSQFLKTVLSSPNYGKSLRWIVSEERIVQEIELSAAQISWDSIFQSVVTPDGILIYVRKNDYFWIPTDSVRDAEERTALHQLIKRKTPSKELH